MKGKKGLWLGCALFLLAAALMLSGGETTGATQQEKRIAQVLSAMDGAGKVEVALFYAQEAGAFGASASVPTVMVTFRFRSRWIWVRSQVQSIIRISAVSRPARRSRSASSILVTAK